MHIERLILGPLQTNCYLVSSNENSPCVLVIDPADEPQRLLARIGDRKVSAVLLTHGHFDHTGALNALSAAPIVIHEADACFLTDKHFGSGGFDYIPYEIRPAANRPVKDGETLFFEGFEKLPVRVLHTPGHTPGSCIYMLEDDTGKHYFTGDTLFQQGYGRYDLPGGNAVQLFHSMKMLLSRPEDALVYPGHGESTTLSHERGLL